VSYLSDYLKGLSNDWQPDGGKEKIKGQWDPNRKQWNLDYFSKCSYVAILGDAKEIYYALVDLPNEFDARSFWKWNQVGSSCFRIFENTTGLVVAEWYGPDCFGQKSEKNRCDI
jgi:hypothetical protein